MQAFLAYTDALNAWDLERILHAFDDTLEHRILPKSLGRPVLNRKQYTTYITGIYPLFKWFHVAIHEVTESKDVLTVHASATGEGASGAPYANEIIMIIHFVPPKEGEDGLPKMALVKEFVDSTLVTKFFKEERAHAMEAVRRMS